MNFGSDHAAHIASDGFAQLLGVDAPDALRRGGVAAEDLLHRT